LRSADFTRTVDGHASRLRHKLGFVGEHWIINMRCSATASFETCPWRQQLGARQPW
jgi:DNA-binding response OmpR family regulator